LGEGKIVERPVWHENRRSIPSATTWWNETRYDIHENESIDKGRGVQAKISTTSAEDRPKAENGKAKGL
jgi:hypothetical protein